MNSNDTRQNNVSGLFHHFCAAHSHCNSDVGDLKAGASFTPSRPVNATISLAFSMLYIMKNDGIAGIGIFGNDGMIGNASLMSGEMTSRATIQGAGQCGQSEIRDVKQS